LSAIRASSSALLGSLTTKEKPVGIVYHVGCRLLQLMMLVTFQLLTKEGPRMGAFNRPGGQKTSLAQPVGEDQNVMRGQEAIGEV
jgi:hypothetical protein